MRKYLFIAIYFVFTYSLFGEGFKLLKQSETEDSYGIALVQINSDKTISEYNILDYLIKEYKKNHKEQLSDYFVFMDSGDEEIFIWCFKQLSDAMEHFKWCESNKIISIETESTGLGLFVLMGLISMEDAIELAKEIPPEQKKNDKRDKWRTYCKESDYYIKEGWDEGVIAYWIYPDERKKNYDSWR